jgi:hypothetical protein
MVLTRFRIVAGLLLLLAPSAPSALGAQDKQALCRNVETHSFTVGKWATYNWTGGQTAGSTMRMAVIGQEMHGGTKFYWYELTIVDPKRGARGRMIMQTLVSGLGTGARGVRAVVIKSGDEPAMKMPEAMVQAMSSSQGANVAAELARQCMEMEIVGTENVTVPGGRFTAIHMRHPQSGMNVWVQPNLDFAMVKATMKDGGRMELTGQGTGAKSSITETPREMTGFPGAPPPR